jgi:hypothetical protein
VSHESEEAVMNVTETAKKAAYLLLFAFAIYYLVTQPANSAHAVRSVVDFLGNALQAIAKFFRTLVA